MTLSKSSRQFRAAERLLWLLPLLAASTGLALLYFFAPPYLFHQGFPLDDAWIHAVYARELARSGTLAYNPGIPATGETAPLWPVVLVPLHALLASVPAIVWGTKAVGIVLHALACTILGVALARVLPERRWIGYAAASLVAIHPHLAAASVSGMEVPLAEVVIASAFAATVRGSRAGALLCGALIIGARPEGAVITTLLPLLFWNGSNGRQGPKLTIAALAGSVAALALLGARNRLVSGLLLPATFYAKANRGTPWAPQLQGAGFIDLFGRIPLLDSVAALLILAGIAIFLLWGRGEDEAGRAAAALYISGAGFCAVSFALVPPVDAAAFYHQRYVLPGVGPIVAALPLLVDAVVRRLVPAAARLVNPIVIAAALAILVVATPGRARHLSNDAHNVDDVQVAFGKALQKAPASAVAWVVDAGGSRFFGQPFVVDMIGLNSPELLGAGGQQYLDAHPPDYFDVFPGWSRLESTSTVQMPAETFETSTPYTVTSAPSMRSHILVTCRPPGLGGRFIVRGKPWSFRCP